jgi:hypothetical protein
MSVSGFEGDTKRKKKENWRSISKKIEQKWVGHCCHWHCSMLFKREEKEIENRNQTGFEKLEKLLQKKLEPYGKYLPGNCCDRDTLQYICRIPRFLCKILPNLFIP